MELWVEAMLVTLLGAMMLGWGILICLLAEEIVATAENPEDENE